MKNLISNTAFGKLLLTKRLSDKQVRDVRDNYDEFLSLLLEMWMFFPCKSFRGTWVVLEEPIYKNNCVGQGKYERELKEYQQAKERCLFEGYDGTIEHLQNLLKIKITVENMVKYYLELTPTALKQIGL
jgi:hypothetical protein